MNYTNLYTRAADDTIVFPAGNLGLSWAAFMMGIPQSFSIDDFVAPELQSPFYSVYGQDTWRVTPNLTLNFGLRCEYENGIVESERRDIVGWDPDAITSITALAEAAYAASPNPNRPASTFLVRGGPIFASDPGSNGRSWKGQSMWMPRISGAYRLGSRTVLKGGYGMFYDTLNASTYTPLTTGYSATSTGSRATTSDRPGRSATRRSASCRRPIRSPSAPTAPATTRPSATAWGSTPCSATASRSATRTVNIRESSAIARASSASCGARPPSKSPTTTRSAIACR